MRNNRRFGNNKEVEYVNLFKKLTGNKNIFTSRNESKRMDSLKVDIIGTPFLFQIKAGKQNSVQFFKYTKELEKYKEDMMEHYQQMLYVVIHHDNKTKGKRERQKTDTLVYINIIEAKKIYIKNNFYEKIINNSFSDKEVVNRKIKPSKKTIKKFLNENKLVMYSDVVVMTLDTFIKSWEKELR